MRLNLVQGWGCQGVQAMAPTTEPAMMPGLAALLGEPDAGGLEVSGAFGAFVGRGAGGGVGTGAAEAGGGVGRGAGAVGESSTT